MNLRPAFLIAALVLAAPRLQAEPGLTAASTLQRPLAARPLGLGEAFSAVDGGLDSLGYNPAGSARLERPELETSYVRGIASDDFGFLGYAHPLHFATITGGLVYYNAGNIDISLSNGTKESRTAQQDMVGLLSASFPLAWGLCAGGTAKFYRFELAQEAKASGFAGDLGALWHSPLSGLNLGASLQNLGPDVKFEQAGDPLPLTTRFGAAYDFNLAKYHWVQEGGWGVSRFLVTADGVKLRDQKSLLPAAGLEMGMGLGEEGSGALRFGYLFSRDISNFTFGVGFRQGRWRLDYALGVGRADVTSTHHITVGASF
ncbi:MAG: PorV/PorQ family protein [Elusimicrobia bacterium]|nr:PorV/PorQ family protein [Elusimicrobiota bacterium]